MINYDKRIIYLLENFNVKTDDFTNLDFQHGIDDAKTIINYLKNHLAYCN